MNEFLAAGPSVYATVMQSEFNKLWNIPSGIVVCENKLGDTSGFGFSTYGMVARLECKGYENAEAKQKSVYTFNFMLTIFPGNCGMCIASCFYSKLLSKKLGWWSLEWAEYLGYLAGYSRIIATITGEQYQMKKLLTKNSWEEMGRTFVNKRSGGHIFTFFKDLPKGKVNHKLKSPVKLIEGDGGIGFEKQVYHLKDVEPVFN